MSDYLDAAQIARLEALKMVVGSRHQFGAQSAYEMVVTAEMVARFILDGTAPERPTEQSGVAT